MRKSIHSPPFEVLRVELLHGRKNAQLTQTALSKRLGKPQSYVAKYENKERRLDLIEVIEICDVLAIELNSLIARVRMSMSSAD